MRIAIVGAGAMGTFLGHGLCKGGHEVTLLDLPARIAQIQSAGKITVIGTDDAESSVVPSLLTADYAKAGVHDLVILATKSQDLPAIAHKIPLLADSSTVILTIQNGLPWWYFQGLDSDTGISRINCLDPDGSLERYIDASQIIGCVAYPAAMMEPDGKVRHVEGDRFPVGELDGSTRARTKKLVSIFEDAGFRSRVIDDIRSELWLKAWGAVSINPVSALTRATMEDICSFPETCSVIEQMMREVQELAEALGASFRHTIERRIEGARAVGAHKTSMLQDVESGRPLELDALMLAIIELADRTGKNVPTVKTVYACTALLNDSLLARMEQLKERIA
jgi:2-dehydropantoate 2-reductase